MKKQFKLYFLTIALTIFGYHTVSAQCTNINISLNSTISTCQSNGTIGVSVSGSDLPNLQMSTAEYNIVPVGGSSYSRPWAQAPGGTLTDVPPGNYTVGLRAFCTTSGSWTVHSTTATISVTSNYTVPNVYLGTIRKTLSCIPSGKIPIVIQHGRVPFVITMTAYPVGYTGPTSATITTLSGTPPSATYNFDDLPAGNYTFSIIDDCTYNTTLNATIATASADFAAGFAYNYPYMPTVAAATLTDCQSVRLYVVYNTTANTTHDAYDHYFNNAAKYYEVAFNENNTTPPVTGWATPTTYMNYSLSVPFDQFRAQNKYVAIWVRIVGSACPPALLRTVSLYTSYSTSLQYSNVTCTDFTVSHYPTYASLYTFCLPYEWRITTNSGAVVILPWSSPVSTANVYQVANNIPYGARIEYRDYSGQTWTYNLMATTPMSNISASYGTSNCLSGSLPPTINGILSGYVLISYSQGTFPIGTRIEYLSGPPGAPTPTYPDITTTTAVSNVYPFSSATNYTSQPAPYPLNVPGIYSFRVTVPTCAPQTYSINPLFYRIVTPLSYTSTETCDGLEIYPTGQLGYVQGASSVTSTTWFSIETAPVGVTVDRTGVAAGGSLLLPASGSYVIKMTYSQSTNQTNYCAASTIVVNYTKKQLELDVSVTSAYVCAGGGLTGNIRVQGANGSGNYTYELWSSDLLTLYQTNSAGTFSHGNANQTFVVRVIDNVCNTSFDQSVTILDLSSAQIVYSGSQNNEFCEGGAIQLNCITLGQTSYTWSGPNGWTSTVQNPTIPNAVPGMSGTYTVTVTPENCGLPMSQTIVVKVNPKPPLPTVPNTSASFCQNATAQTIAAITGASATSSSYAIRYYNSGGSTITSTTTVPTSAATVLTYYVVQYNTATGCESDQVSVTVTIHELPVAPAVNPVSAMCPNTLFSIIAPTTVGYYYKVYTASSGGTLLGQSPVNSGVISGLTAPASSSTYYVSAVNAANCESPSRTPVAIPINPAATTANITASGVSICSGTAATLTATSGLASSTFNWYASQTATVPLHTGATYTTGILTTSTTYYVGVSNPTTCENAVNNRLAVAVTVTPTVTPTISISGATATCSGTSETYTASVTNGGSPPGYQWRVNGAPVTGEIGSTFVYEPVNGDIITCVLTSSATCPNPNPVTSSGLTVAVTPTVIPAISVSGVPD